MDDRLRPIKNRQGLKVRKVARNSALLLASKIVDGITQLASISIIARFLGPALFGEYAFVITVTFMFGILISFGTGPVLIREISKDKSRVSLYVFTVLLIRIVIAAFLLSALYIAISYFNFSIFIVHGLKVMGIAYCFLALTKTFEEVYIAHEKMGIILYLTFVVRILSFSLLVFVYWLEMSFLWVYYAPLIAFIIQGVVSVLVCKKYFLNQTLSLSMQELRFFLKESYFLFCSMLFRQLNIRVDVFFLQALVSSKDLSLFHAPHRIIMNLQPLSASIASALFAPLTKIGEESKELLAESFENTFKLFLVGSLMATALFNIWAEQIILILFSAEFIDSVLYLRIMSWALLSVFLNAILEMFLVITSQQKRMFYVSFIGFAINCILDIVLIKNYGVVGAVWATTISYIFITFLLFHYLATYFSKISMYKIIIQTVVSLVFIVYLTQTYLSHVPIQATAVFFISYFFFLFATKMISKKDVLFIKNVLLKRKRRPHGC